MKQTTCYKNKHIVFHRQQILINISWFLFNIYCRAGTA